MKSSEFVSEASIFDERTLKNTVWKNPSHTYRWLKENGFKKIGSGHYANVFAKPGHNRIVKISNQQDDCWIKFAQWAMTKTNNKYLPKIPWIKRYQGKKQGRPQEFFITIIERLTPVTEVDLQNITDPAILVGIYVYADLYKKTSNKIKSKIRDNADDPENEDWVQHEIDKYKNHPFLKTLAQIKNMTGDCWYDLHAGNLMTRQDGTIVITDPIA